MFDERLCLILVYKGTSGLTRKHLGDKSPTLLPLVLWLVTTDEDNPKGTRCLGMIIHPPLLVIVLP